MGVQCQQQPLQAPSAKVQVVNAHPAAMGERCPWGWGHQHHPQPLLCQAMALCLQCCFMRQNQTAPPQHIPSGTCKTTEDAGGDFCFLPFLICGVFMIPGPDAWRCHNGKKKKKKDPIIALKSSTLKQRNRYSKIQSTQKAAVMSKNRGCKQMARLQPGIKPAQCRTEYCPAYPVVSSLLILVS